MKFIHPLARSVFIAAIVGIVFAPVPLVAEESKSVANIFFSGSEDSSAPLNLIDQGATVITMMRDANVDEQAIKAIEDFQKFISDNKSLFERPISELSQADRIQLQTGYSNALAGMEAIKPLAEVLSSREWLTKADPDLAGRLRERCGRTFVSGRDVVKEFGKIFSNPTGYDGDTVNIVEDFTGIHRECAESAADFAALAAQESARLAAVIEREERLLAKAIADGDQEAIDRHTANLEKARQDKKEVDRDFDWSQALKFLSGLGQAIGGVVGIIASGGSCVPCYAAVANGVYDGYSAIDAMTGSDTVVVSSPASRPGIDPSADVSQEEFSEAVAEIDVDPRYEVISPKNPGGNFIVTREVETGYLVIHQIKPEPLIIRLDLKNVVAGSGFDADVLPLERLTEVEWISIETTDGISPTRINLLIDGKLDDKAIRVSLNENPVGEPIIVTATAN